MTLLRAIIIYSLNGIINTTVNMLNVNFYFLFRASLSIFKT